MVADVQGSIVTVPENAVFSGRKDRQARLLEAATRRRKYQPTESIDATIREAYRRLLVERDRTATRWAQQQTGWPKFMVNRRAAELGLSRVKEPNWQPRGLEISSGARPPGCGRHTTAAGSRGIPAFPRWRHPEAKRENPGRFSRRNESPEMDAHGFAGIRYSCNLPGGLDDILPTEVPA